MKYLSINKKIYVITTSLPYVNSTPHIGFAMEAVISDLIARYLRSIGKKVIFISGTDDNSFKLALKAMESGEETKNFVNRFANNFLDLKDALALSYDVFYRTNSEEHGLFVNKYTASINSDLVFKKKFQSYFCQDCESFVGLNIKDPKICPIHNKQYILIDEENYFFKVDKFKNKISKNIRNKTILPLHEKENSLEMCKNFSDFNFTRENLHKWGIIYKRDPKYVFYSFFDALLGYLGAIEGVVIDDDTCIIQNIGRDILKFHSVYFPCIIFISQKKITPDYLLVHGFVNLNSEKMSKSKGNIIPVNDLLLQFDKNVIRIYLSSKEIFTDFDFNYQEIEFISKIYSKYKYNFASDLSLYESSGKSDFFQEKMEGFQFHTLVDQFMSIINIRGSFNEMLSEEKVFLRAFTNIFIIN